MPVVTLRGQLKAISGSGAHDLGGSTIGELLRALEADRPALGGWILDERGRIRRHINVFVNGVQGGADTSVGEGDRIDVLPAISGG
jgi:molybdopterin converting factor small subunit